MKFYNLRVANKHWYTTFFKWFEEFPEKLHEIKNNEFNLKKIFKFFTINLVILYNIKNIIITVT